MSQQTISLRIKGMTCQGCADGIRLTLKRQRGVQEVKINWKSGTGKIIFDPEAITEDVILDTDIFHRGVYSAERAGQIPA